jgi:hypothetical protein
MELSNYPQDCKSSPPIRPSVYRVIDDGQCILTTLSAEKALAALMGLIERHDVTVCWAEREFLL